MDRERTKLLLVEDDEEDYLITRDLLSDIEGNAYDLQWVSTYEEGLEELSLNRHDVYLFDYRLGAHNGLELLREAVKRGCKAPVILLTGQGDKEVDLEAMKAGASDYLVKGKLDAALIERTIRYAVERKRAEEQIRYLAYYDHLTALPNRVLFQELLARVIRDYNRHQRPAAVMFLDLDHFKRINDTLGHNVGDELLRGVAGRLTTCLRKSDAVARSTINDTVGRLGGDEFTILLAKIAHEQDAAKVAQRVCDTLSQPFILQGHEMVVTTSVGITIYPQDGDDLHSLLKNADVAMYHAKTRGRNNYQFYNATLNVAALERLTLENQLRAALDQQEFELYYQPRFDLLTQRVVGMEALIRWRHAEKGFISPEEFIPVAEETGLIIPLGEWVLRAACQQGKRWQEEGFAPIRVSVNLSGRQFKQRDLVARVTQTLKETGLPPRWLELEITESIMMQDKNAAVAMLHEFRKLGVWLSMDDFGIGYSSVSNLKLFPLDAIKIDRTFVKDTTADADGGALVSAIIAMAKNLKLRLIAEGVETEQQRLFLCERQCEEAQGYLFSQPLPADEARRFLSAAPTAKARAS